MTEARRWFVAAEDDLEVAVHLAGGGFHAAACFHAQQAAEKAVKALHYASGARSVFGHSVGRLLSELDDHAFGELADHARELDLLYVPTRYPNGVPGGTPAEAFGPRQSERALEAARAVLGATRAALAVRRDE